MSKLLQNNNAIFYYAVHEALRSRSQVVTEARSSEDELLFKLRFNETEELDCKNGLMVFCVEGIIRESAWHSIVFTFENDDLGQVCVDILDRQGTFDSDIAEVHDAEISPKVIIDRNHIEIQFLEFLKEIGIELRYHAPAIFLKNNKHTEILPKKRDDLIMANFEEYYLRDLVFEINFAWRFGLFNSALTLSRKMIENLVIEILRKKFPVNTGNIDLYYNRDEGRFHDFSLLLRNLENKRNEFSPDERVIDEFLKMAKPFKERANAGAHSIISSSSEEEIKKFDITKMVALLRRIQRFIS